MFLLRMYRFFISVIFGAIIFFSFFSTWWSWLFSSILFRAIWWSIEREINIRSINKCFKEHEYQFKQLCGPYGIRLVNKSKTDKSIKKSLAEVFVKDLNKLKATKDQLEMMDTLFKSGFRPSGDQYQLHDLKLKYCKHRLQYESK